MAAAEAANVDALIGKLNVAYTRVLAAQGKSVALPAKEINLLSILGQLRDYFLQSLRGDRDICVELFGGSCQRVAHVQAIIESLELSPMNASDQRLRGCIGACASVREVLIDLGLQDALRKAMVKEKEVLAAGGKAEALLETAQTPEVEREEEPDAPTESLDPLAAPMQQRPALGAIVEEEWAQLMGVATCKLGCGRRVAPGVTRSGKKFDTCCRGCATGKAHHKLCGLVDPKMVGEGRCKMGCGRRAAEGYDAKGNPRDTCCRACAEGEPHEDTCSLVGAITDDTASDALDRCDERAFFTEVKTSLPEVQFGRFLEQCRMLREGRLTRAEAVDRIGIILGDRGPQLKSEFERLVAEASTNTASEQAVRFATSPPQEATRTRSQILSEEAGVDLATARKLIKENDRATGAALR
mmetsp:Transcript_17026/g.32833  ORF Transcript_17026/g.32833 Transcript_17026/m.32833 type:complete len:413 (+) Transcript_17026:85-1323(+)